MLNSTAPRFGVFGYERVQVPATQLNTDDNMQQVVNEVIGIPHQVIHTGSPYSDGFLNVQNSYLTARRIQSDGPQRKIFRQALAFALGMTGSPRWNEVKAKAREERAQNVGPDDYVSSPGYLEAEMLGVIKRKLYR